MITDLVDIGVAHGRGEGRARGEELVNGVERAQRHDVDREIEKDEDEAQLRRCVDG